MARIEFRWALLLALCCVCVCGGILARAYNLGYANKPEFDEIYFPAVANGYLHGHAVFDVHPPLGKLLIACGIAALGNTAVGWRIVPLLFGIASIGLMAAIWWSMFKDRIGTAIIAILLALDGLFIVYSRVGLMDGMLFFFVFLCFLQGLRLRPSANTALLGATLGLTASIKWIGLAVFVPVAYVAAPKARRARLLFGAALSVLVYCLVLTLGQLLTGSKHPILDSLRWNVRAARYHVTLTAAHPYSSPWWSWPLMKKPVPILYDAASRDTVHAVIARGNLIIWLAATLAVLGSFAALLNTWAKEGRAGVSKHPLTVFLLGYAASMFPLIPIQRPLFLYHYMPAYGFALLMLTYWLTKLWRRAWWLVLTLLIAATALTAYELPLSVGWIPSPEPWASRHV